VPFAQTVLAEHPKLRFGCSLRNSLCGIVPVLALTGA